MNKGRCLHTSVLHNKKLFAIGGSEKYKGQKVDCMECLDLQNPVSWVTIDEGNPLIPPRNNCLASSFSPHEIIIAGGNGSSLFSDVYLFDVRTSTAT